MDIITKILALLFTGALGGFLANYVQESLKIRKAYIKSQIDNLYGPLYFKILQRKKCFKHNEQLISEGHSVYGSHTYDSKISTEQSKQVEKEIKEVIDKANEFGHKGAAFNEEIFNIIESNFSYIDPDDLDIITKFYEDRIRYELETNTEKILSRPIAQKRGRIIVNDENFNKRIEEKFNSKKEELVRWYPKLHFSRHPREAKGRVGNPESETGFPPSRE